jgi:hypothetical protein
LTAAAGDPSRVEPPGNLPQSTTVTVYEQLLASKSDPNTGKPDPAKMKAFLAHHPETAEALKIIKDQPVPSGFGNSTLHSLNAFRFTNATGDTIPVRWFLRPTQPFEAAGPPPAPQDKKYLFEELIAQIHRQPLRWNLFVIVGQQGDPTNDATIAWPAGREQVDVGSITLDRVESDDTSAARDINFDPLVLPAGIAASDDPLLSARNTILLAEDCGRTGPPETTYLTSYAEPVTLYSGATPAPGTQPLRAFWRWAGTGQRVRRFRRPARLAGQGSRQGGQQQRGAVRRPAGLSLADRVAGLWRQQRQQLWAERRDLQISPGRRARRILRRPCFFLEGRHVGRGDSLLGHA